MTITKKFGKIKSEGFFPPLIYNSGKVELEVSYLIRGFTVFIQKFGKAPDLGSKKKEEREKKEKFIIRQLMGKLTKQLTSD